MYEIIVCSKKIMHVVIISCPYRKQITPIGYQIQPGIKTFPPIETNLVLYFCKALKVKFIFHIYIL